MRTIAALLLLTFALPTAAQPAPDAPETWAQTAKGVRILGGGASISRFENNTSALVSPRLGRFVADNLALSASLTLGYSRFSTGDGESLSSTQLGIGPTATYYFGDPAGSAAQPFVEADVNLNYVRRTTDLRGTENADVTIGGVFGAGVKLPIARNVALRGEAFYTVSDLTFDNDISYYGVSVGFSTFIY